MSQACADIVRRDDPQLYKTALFAPEPARSRLMVLYAFDIELSRATRASAESGLAVRGAVLMTIECMSSREDAAGYFIPLRATRIRSSASGYSCPAAAFWTAFIASACL